MSPTATAPDHDPERETLAGEYVFGLIEEDERITLDRRYESDHAFARSVESWRRHLVAIDATATPLPPSTQVWSRIEAALSVPGAAATAASLPTVRGLDMLRGWWNSLPVWRGTALAGALAAVLLAIGLNGALDRARRQPVMVAVLMTDSSVAAAVVNTFADGRVEMLPLQSIQVPEGKALEIWTLWDRAIGPRSVGLIDRARTTPLRLDRLPLGVDQLFEITLEPASGSPTGRPTGPIIAKGTTARAL